MEGERGGRLGVKRIGDAGEARCDRETFLGSKLARPRRE